MPWRTEVRRIAGNPVEMLEVDVDEVAHKLASRSQVWIDIRREGRVVHGLTIDELGAERVG